MHFFEVRHSIAASPERVWMNLVDARKIVEGGLNPSFAKFAKGLQALSEGKHA
jgi:hypothetical protein